MDNGSPEVVSYSAHTPRNNSTLQVLVNPLSNSLNRWKTSSQKISEFTHVIYYKNCTVQVMSSLNFGSEVINKYMWIELWFI